MPAGRGDCVRSFVDGFVNIMPKIVIISAFFFFLWPFAPGSILAGAWGIAIVLTVLIHKIGGRI